MKKIVGYITLGILGLVVLIYSTLGILVSAVIFYIFLPSDGETDSEKYDYASAIDEYEEVEDYESVYSNVSSYTYSSIDHNCSDFDTQRDAQSFYLANGGPYSDRHDLDRDNDSNACDWNP